MESDERIDVIAQDCTVLRLAALPAFVEACCKSLSSPPVRVDFGVQGFLSGLFVMAWEPDKAYLVLVSWEQDVKAMRLRGSWAHISEDLAEERMFLAKASISMMRISDMISVTYALRPLHLEEQ